MASSGSLLEYSLLNVWNFWYLLVIKTNTFSLLKTALKVTLLPAKPEEAHKSPISPKWPQPNGHPLFKSDSTETHSDLSVGWADRILIGINRYDV